MAIVCSSMQQQLDLRLMLSRLPPASRLPCLRFCAAACRKLGAPPRKLGAQAVRHRRPTRKHTRPPSSSEKVTLLSVVTQASLHRLASLFVTEVFFYNTEAEVSIPLLSCIEGSICYPFLPRFHLLMLKASKGLATVLSCISAKHFLCLVAAA